jgi:hypothetical protein
MATTMEKERLYNLITYIGTRLSRSISVEYFNNLMNTLLSHNDAKQALILFMVHLKMMAKWLIIRNSIANEIIEKVIQIYNTTNDQEKVEVLAYMRKYLPWIYESNPREAYDTIWQLIQKTPEDLLLK